MDCFEHSNFLLVSNRIRTVFAEYCANNDIMYFTNFGKRAVRCILPSAQLFDNSPHRIRRCILLHIIFRFHALQRKRMNNNLLFTVLGEKVLCFHGPLIYEAKALKSVVSKEKQVKYFIHYAGWNKK